MVEEEQYIINRRNRRQKYVENKAIVNHEKLKRRIEDLRTKNVISSVLKSQRQNRNIDENINDLIDKIKDTNPEYSQEQVRNKLQQDYDIRDKKIKIPEFVDDKTADDIFDKISLQSPSTILRKAKATTDPNLKERLLEQYKIRYQMEKIIKKGGIPPGPALPVGFQPRMTTRSQTAQAVAPTLAQTMAQSQIQTRGMKQKVALKNLQQAQQTQAQQIGQAKGQTPAQITQSIAQAPTQSQAMAQLPLTSQIPLSKVELAALAKARQAILDDDLLNASTAIQETPNEQKARLAREAKEEKARLKAEKEANRQPYFGKKKTGKGFKKINPKYLYSYNTIN